MNPATLSPKGIATLINGNNAHVVLQVLNLQDDVKEVENGKAFVS